MEEIVKIIGNTCLKHHDSGEASVNREARLIIQALKEKGYEIILMPKGELTAMDFEKTIAEEAKNGNELNAYIRCFQLAQQMVAKAVEENEKELINFIGQIEKLKIEIIHLKADIATTKLKLQTTGTKTLEHFQNEIAKKNGFKDYDHATRTADTDKYHRIIFEAEQKFEEYKTQQTAQPISDKPFATWLRTNNYFKSKKGEKKTYENKFIEGFFTRKVLYKKFKIANSQQSK